MKKFFYRAALLVLLGIFAYSAFSLGSYFLNSYRSQQLNGNLQQIVEENRPTRPQVNQSQNEQDATQSTETTEPAFVTVTDPDTGEERQILPEYAELYLLNNDLVGWIQVPGTPINYPVMQTPDSPNYYLRKDFEGNYDNHGSIYADEAADVFAPSDNITLYGHHMHDNTMFAPLFDYIYRSTQEANPYFYFDTLTERHTYEIVIVFRTQAILDGGFDYHNFVNAANEAEFNAFIDECRANAIYKINKDVEYGDKLVTLSTCDFTLEEGRLVIVGKRID